MDVTHLYQCIVLGVMFSQKKAFLPQMYGELSASHEFYFLGDTVQFTCRVTNSSVLTVMNSSTEDIYLRRSKSREALGKVTSRDKTSVTFVMEVTSVNDSGIYYCTVGPAPQERLGLGNWFIQVEYQLEAVNNMSCVTENFLSIACRYELPLDYIHPEKIIATVFYFLPDYEEPEEEAYRGVERNFTLGPGNNLDSNYTFTILLTHTERNESALSSPFFFNPQTEVKPDRVKHLRVINVTSSTVFLRWGSPDEHHPFICSVKSFTGTTTHKLNREDVSIVLEPSREQEMKLSGLVPFTTYNCSVQCRPTRWTHQPFGYNGDKVVISFKTLPDAPDVAPLLAPAISRPTLQDIQLYWQPLEKIRENGPLLHYNLKLEYGGHGVTKKVNISQHSLRFPLNNTKLHVSLSVINQVGESPASTLTVFPRHTEPKFRVTGRGNNSEVTFHWTAEAGFTRCHVFWCQKKLADTSCQHQLFWKTLPCMTESVTVDTGRAVGEQSLLMGFSSQMAGPPHSGSSIAWTHCIYVMHAVPGLMTGLKGSRTQPPGGIQLEWRSPDCVEAPVFLSNYLVSYCTVRKRNNTCAGPIMNDTVSSGHTRHEIRGLKADLYRVTVRAVSLGSHGPDSAPMYFRVKPESDGKQLPTTTLFVVLGVAVFVLLAILGPCLVFRFKAICFEREEIETPENPDYKDVNKLTTVKRRKRRRGQSTVEECEMCGVGNISDVKIPSVEGRDSSPFETGSESSCEGDTYRIFATSDVVVHEASTSGIEESGESDGLMTNCGSSISHESAVGDMDWDMTEGFGRLSIPDSQCNLVYQPSNVEAKEGPNRFLKSPPQGYVTLTDTGSLLSIRPGNMLTNSVR